MYLMWHDKCPLTHSAQYERSRWVNASRVCTPFLLQMYGLLENWQALPPEKAMELLDHHYPDIAVRNWAVNSLENME